MSKAAIPAVGAGMAVQLSSRDVAMLKGLHYDRCNSVEVLAKRHWGATRGAVDAVLRRLVKLEKAGLVEVVAQHERIVYLTPRGARAVGERRSGRVHPRHLVHHLQTLKAIETVRERLEAQGARMVEYQLEVHIQAAERQEKSGDGGTAPGQRYDVAPDAVVKVQLPNGQVQHVALEYYTRSYSDAQIAEKMELQQNYDDVVQVSDNASTALRVEGITERPCEILG